MDFVIFKEKGTFLRIILPIDKITSIVECEDETAFVETGLDKNDERYSRGFYVEQKFDDIMYLLSDKIKIN